MTTRVAAGTFWQEPAPHTTTVYAAGGCAIGISAEEAKTGRFMKGRGCDKCGGSGYKGRQGLYELLVIDDQIRHMTVERVSAGVIKNYALEHCNLRTLISDGKLNVLNGRTTPQEVLRVCQREEI